MMPYATTQSDDAPAARAKALSTFGQVVAHAGGQSTAYKGETESR